MTIQSESNGVEKKIFLANGNQKKAEVAILTTDKNRVKEGCTVDP